MRSVLILGGYGAVGRQAAASLIKLRPGLRVSLAGRHPETAALVPGTSTVMVDANEPSSLHCALDGVEAVLNCIETRNAEVARSVLQRGIGYVDVSASHPTHLEIEQLNGLAVGRGARAVLSVGLVPGASNLLAAMVAEGSDRKHLDIGVLLGLGGGHGPAALGWTLDGIGRLHGSWAMGFPEPVGFRTVHAFPFSDQYSLPKTLGVEQVRTGLCLSSRLLTRCLGALAEAGAARPSQNRAVRMILSRLLSVLKVGDDRFVVSAMSSAAQATLAGRDQSKVTGDIAAQVVHRLPTFPPGVNHLEQLVEPHAFLAELSSAVLTHR